MSPTRLTKMDELNYAIQERNTNHFKLLMERNHVPYRVAIFKAIESGSFRLFNIVKQYHSQLDMDIELECIHAAFRCHLNIYENIYFAEETEEFNPYVENMYLCHGRFDKINLIEINMHDLLSPNTIPVEVCNYLAQQAPNNSCLMTGVLLAYCIHNNDNYIRLENNPNLFVMDIMFQYATQHRNQDLVLFLLQQFRSTRQYSTYQYDKRENCFQKSRHYVKNNLELFMYDHYLLSTSPLDNKPRNNKVRGNTTRRIYPNNLCLSKEMFEWPSTLLEKENDDYVDAYFEQVIDQVHRLIDAEVLLKL